MSDKQIEAHNKTVSKASRTIVSSFNLRTVAADTLTAAVVSGLCAIPISIIDFSIMSKVAGVVPTMGHQVKAGTKTLFTDPFHFFVKDRPNTYNALVYRICFSVYFTTYLTANTTRTWYESSGADAETTAWMAGISSSVINTGMTVWKDSVILRALPQAMSGGKVYIPYLSRFGFAFRDTLTCIAAFTMVPLLRDYFLRTQPDWSLQQCKTTASFITPVSMQLITTVVHIPSITYQRMYKEGRMWAGPEGYMAGIVKGLKLDYIGALRLRMLRIFCAFGIGTLISSDLRLNLATRFDPASVKKV